MYSYIVCLGDGILNYHITIQPLRRVAVVPCGDGRTRTAVQTPHQAAFYTLSLALVFDLGLPSDRLPEAYPLDLSGA